MRVSGIPFVQGRNGYTDGDGRKYGIAIHNTSNDAPAEGEASYATRRTDGTSSHFYVDGDSIVQSLDTNVRAGHAGSRYGNENAIAFEITGVNAKTRQWWLDNVAWDQLARVCAVLCNHYGIEPRRASVSEMRSNPQVRAFYGHDDMRQAWGGTTHTDPGGNFPWDHLLAKVRQAMTGQPEGDDMSATAEKQIADLHAAFLGAGSGSYPASVVEKIKDMAWAVVKGNTSTTWLGQSMVALAGAAGVDAAELEQIKAAAREGAAAGADQIVAAVVAQLPDGSGPVSREDLVAALRSVLGSVDNPA